MRTPRGLKATLLTIAICFGVPTLMGYVWNTTAVTSFEETPQDSAVVSQGALQIRTTREEVRRRASVEHDWSTANVGDLDSGRHRLGSARLFYATPAPTQIPYADTSAAPSTALDAGRMWVDTNTKTLKVYDGSAWQSVQANIPVIAATAAEPGATNCLKGGVARDWGGGVVSVAIPQYGTWMIEVFGELTEAAGSNDPNNPLYYNLSIAQDPGTGVYASVEMMSTVVPRQTNDAPTMPISVHYLNLAVTNNVTYNFKLQCINSSANVNYSSGSGRLSVIARRQY